MKIKYKHKRLSIIQLNSIILLIFWFIFLKTKMSFSSLFSVHFKESFSIFFFFKKKTKDISKFKFKKEVEIMNDKIINYFISSLVSSFESSFAKSLAACLAASLSISCLLNDSGLKNLFSLNSFNLSSAVITPNKPLLKFQKNNIK